MGGHLKPGTLKPVSRISGVRGVRWDRVYGTNLDQVGPDMAKLDQFGQVGRHFAVFCLLRKAPLTNLDQVGPVLFPTIFRALLSIFRIFRVFASAFSAFLLCGVFSNPCFCRVSLPHFPHFRRIGFESLISKIRPTGFIVTGLR